MPRMPRAPQGLKYKMRWFELSKDTLVYTATSESVRDVNAKIRVFGVHELVWARKVKGAKFEVRLMPQTSLLLLPPLMDRPDRRCSPAPRHYSGQPPALLRTHPHAQGQPLGSQLEAMQLPPALPAPTPPCPRPAAQIPRAHSGAACADGGGRRRVAGGDREG
jgi:hypothetical protein